MAYVQTIGQTVVDSSFSTDTNLISGTVMRLSVYALPGCQINIDGSVITLNNTGLFNADFPESMWGTAGIGITSVTITDVTNKLLTGANTKMVVDYISIKEE